MIRTMVWIIACGGVIGTWALLNIIGGERQRRLMEIQHRALLEAEASRPSAEAIPEVS